MNEDELIQSAEAEAVIEYKRLLAAGYTDHEAREMVYGSEKVKDD